MASRMQVKNGKAFDFDKMVINWDGSQYPFRELSFTNAPFYTFVSIVALERKLLNFYGEPVNSIAEWIDNQISYYFDSTDYLNLNNNDLYNFIYKK